MDSRLVSFIFVMTVIAAPPSTLAQSANQQEQQAAIFLERVLRPWSLVLKPWDRDASREEWAAAGLDCMAPKEVANTKPAGDAEDALPPKSELFGSLAFYRGTKGLQSIGLMSGVIEVFPDVQVGVSKAGTPVYQIANGNRTVQIAMGKVPVEGKPSVVMNFDGGLYLSCRQPESDG